ncbi:MAG: heme o synthase [Halobacteriales archaeon]
MPPSDAGRRGETACDGPRSDEAGRDKNGRGGFRSDEAGRDQDGHDGTGTRLAGLLAGSAVGVYLLVVVGATTALLDGAGSCATWPACNGAWLPDIGDVGMVVAWSHRVGTVLVGLLLLATAWVAFRNSSPRRVRAALGVALLSYPVQIAVGALTVVGATTTALAAVHLVVAVAIFTAIVLALLWSLEAVTPSEPVGDADPSTASGTGPPPETPLGPGGPAGTASEVDASNRASVTSGQAPSLRDRAVGYVLLTKPKLWWLLCLVAVAAMALAAGPALDVGTVVPTVAGGVFAIGASGTFNHVLERDVDRRMSRTDERPLVEGHVPVRHALAFGFVLAGASVAVFLAFVNVLAAALGVMAILFYSVGYTLVLKPNTSQNVVIGGAVGAFPALIGWAAVENTVGVPALVLGGVIFLWTPAHFYNLALAYREDYANAGIPMLPVVRGAVVTRRHILAYLGATMVGAVLLGTTATLGWAFALTATVAGGVFLWAVVHLHRERTEAAAFRAFHASNGYLASLLLVVIVDALVV